MELNPRYQVGDRVLYCASRYNGEIQSTSVIKVINIDEDGIKYKMNNSNLFIKEAGIICKRTKANEFIDILKRNEPNWFKASNFEHKDNILKFCLINCEQIEYVLFYLKEFFVEGSDYELDITYITDSGRVEDTMLIVKFKEGIYKEEKLIEIEKNIGKTRTMINLAQTSVETYDNGSVIIKKDKDNDSGSVEVLTPPYCTTADDLLKLNVYYPPHMERELLESEHLKFLLAPEFDEDLRDKALTLIIIKRMCKEQLDEYRKMKLDEKNK